MRNKFGYPFVFDFPKRTDARRMNNINKMIKTCPQDMKNMWKDKLKQLKDNINARKEDRKSLN
jgi:hypothetical protein